jgi:hypothetical protein
VILLSAAGHTIRSLTSTVHVPKLSPSTRPPQRPRFDLTLWYAPGSFR